MFKQFVRFFEMLAHLPYFPRQPEISPPAYKATSDWLTLLVDEYNKPGMAVLEIGSRNVTGANHRSRFGQANYIGLDIHPGENVDIVGDIHKLEAYFEPGTQFDLIFCSAVFEHLYAPWLASEQMSRMLKVGGKVFVETHFSWRAHERPWNFFQFSDMGLRALFNQGLGYHVLDVGMDNPMIGFYTRLADPNLRYRKIRELYAHSMILAEKTHAVEHFDWSTIPVQQIVGETSYPEPKQ